MIYIKQNCLQCLEDEFSAISGNQQTVTASNNMFSEHYSDLAKDSIKVKHMMELFYHTSNNWSSQQYNEKNEN